MDLATEGVVKVTDFGLGRTSAATATRIDRLLASMDSAAGREIAGTLDYMAPEAAAGRRERRWARRSLRVWRGALRDADRRTPGRDRSAQRIEPRRSASISTKRSAALTPGWISDLRRPTNFAACLRPARRRWSPSQHRPDSRRRRSRSARGAIGSARNAASRSKPGDQFCMRCGVQLVENVRRCPQCGAYPDPTDQFCIFCGQTLSTPLGTAAPRGVRHRMLPALCDRLHRGRGDRRSQHPAVQRLGGRVDLPARLQRAVPVVSAGHAHRCQ